MTNREFLQANKAFTTEILANMLNELETSKQKVTDKQLILNYTMFAENLKTVLNVGFEECLMLVNKIDVGFLNRKLPPHMKAFKRDFAEIVKKETSNF